MSKVTANEVLQCSCELHIAIHFYSSLIFWSWWGFIIQCILFYTLKNFFLLFIKCITVFFFFFHSCHYCFIKVQKNQQLASHKHPVECHSKELQRNSHQMAKTTGRIVLNNCQSPFTIRLLVISAWKNSLYTYNDFVSHVVDWAVHIITYIEDIIFNGRHKSGFGKGTAENLTSICFEHLRGGEKTKQKQQQTDNVYQEWISNMRIEISILLMRKYLSPIREGFPIPSLSQNLPHLFFLPISIVLASFFLFLVSLNFQSSFLGSFCDLCSFKNNATKMK